MQTSISSPKSSFAKRSIRQKVHSPKKYSAKGFSPKSAFAETFSPNSSSPKMYSPKGAGTLLLRSRVPLLAASPRSIVYCWSHVITAMILHIFSVTNSSPNSARMRPLNLSSPVPEFGLRAKLLASDFAYR